jgi:hypothetical protein
MGIMTVGFGTGIYGFIPVLHNTQELHSASCLQDTWLSQVTAKAPEVTAWLESKDWWKSLRSGKAASTRYNESRRFVDYIIACRVHKSSESTLESPTRLLSSGYPFG